MENINRGSSPTLKLFELNIRDRCFQDKITNVSNLSTAEKIKNKRNYNYKNININGKTQEFNERNKSTLMPNNRNFYSLEYYNSIKSLKKKNIKIIIKRIKKLKKSIII